MKKMSIVILILLIFTSLLITNGCVSGSSATTKTATTEEKMPDVEWDGITTINPEGGFFYDDIPDGGSSENLGTFEDGKLILKGSVTTQFQYGFIGNGLEMTIEYKNRLISAKGIKFKAKGDGKSYRFRMESRKVADFDHFGYVFRSSAEETVIEIPYKKLTQEGWGSPVTFNPRDVYQISFQTVGQPHESVYLEVYDVEIIPIN